MAILADLGVEVTVQSRGAQAPEYDDTEAETVKEEAATTVCHKYIEVTDDAEFSIKVTVSASSAVRDPRLWREKYNNCITCWPYIDGRKSPGRNFNAYGSTQRIEGVDEYFAETPFATRRKFKFVMVETVDDGDSRRIQRDAQAAKDLGTIKVELWRSLLSGQAYTPDRTYDPPITETFSLAEKALKGKAISHGTGFTQGVRVSKPRCQSVNYMDEKPIAVFYFKYRSREALQRELIIPRTPIASPTPPPENSIDHLSMSEMRRLAGERLAQIKREKREPSITSGIKREIGHIGAVAVTPPRKVSRTISRPVVIDLTDD